MNKLADIAIALGLLGLPWTALRAGSGVATGVALLSVGVFFVAVRPRWQGLGHFWLAALLGANLLVCLGRALAGH